MKPLIIRVKEKRELLRISLAELSKRLDIPYDRMSKWEKRGTTPKTEDAKKLEDWLNDSPVYQVNIKTPSDTEALVSVLAGMVSELLAVQSGRSSIVEHEYIMKDAAELKRIRKT